MSQFYCSWHVYQREIINILKDANFCVSSGLTIPSSNIDNTCTGQYKQKQRDMYYEKSARIAIEVTWDALVDP
jgi:hypothetical protein